MLYKASDELRTQIGKRPNNGKTPTVALRDKTSDEMRLLSASRKWIKLTGFKEHPETTEARPGTAKVGCRTKS
jgi:hypothetical protein